MPDLAIVGAVLGAIAGLYLAGQEAQERRARNERAAARRETLDRRRPSSGQWRRARQLRFNATVTDASSAAAQRRRSITLFRARWEVPFTLWVICNRCASSATSGKLHGRQARFGDTCGESRSDECFLVARRNKGLSPTRPSRTDARSPPSVSSWRRDSAQADADECDHGVRRSRIRLLIVVRDRVAVERVQPLEQVAVAPPLTL